MASYSIPDLFGLVFKTNSYIQFWSHFSLIFFVLNILVSFQFQKVSYRLLYKLSSVFVVINSYKCYVLTLFIVAKYKSYVELTRLCNDG